MHQATLVALNVADRWRKESAVPVVQWRKTPINRTAAETSAVETINGSRLKKHTGACLCLHGTCRRKAPLHQNCVTASTLSNMTGASIKLRGPNPEQEPRPRLSFTTDQWIPYPVPIVFAFFSEPANLPRLMPGWQDARIDSLELQAPDRSDMPQAAGRGSRILLSFRPLPFSPIRLRWLALIDDFVANHRFCDLQVTGPFGYWRHCHLVVEETRHGVTGTRITDVVDYEWPVGRLSPAIDLLGGRLQIRQIFRYRQRQVLDLLAKQRPLSS